MNLLGDRGQAGADSRTTAGEIVPGELQPVGRRVAVTVTALVALCAVGAAGQRLPSRLPAQVFSLSPSGAVAVVVAVLLAAVGVGFGVVGYVAWAERAPQAAEPEPPRPVEEEPQRVIDWWSALPLPLLFLSLLALALALGWLFGHPAVDGDGTGRPETPRVRGPAPPPGGGAGDTVPVDWLVFAVLAGVGGVAATALLVRDRRRRCDVLDDRDRLVVAVDESLEDLEREPDPRAAVIKAYAGMERSLAARGEARRPPETPLEYLARVLAAVAVSQAAVERLTALFQEAEFSRHAVDPAMKGAAIAALRDLRAELVAREPVEAA